MLLFKKGHTTISTYWKGSTISFQTTNLEWQKGEITKIENDSVYIRPVIIHYYLMGTDTVHMNIERFSIADIFAMPKKGLLIDYIDGRFQISRSGGHVGFYWVKSGLIFRMGAVGYAALNIINGLIDKDLSIADSKKPLGIAALVFLGGVLLHKTYKPVLILGKKYHFEIVKL